MFIEAAITFDMILRFLGRLHPMTVHFPIALLVVAALIELWSPRRDPEAKGPSAAMVCLTIGAWSAVLAAFLGWMNAEHENHGRALEQTLFWHRWLGVSLAGVAVITWIFGLVQSRRPGVGTRRAYRLGLIATVGLVAVTGHLGGVMTYGDEYLTEPFTAPQRAESTGDSNAATSATERPAAESSTSSSAPDPAVSWSENEALFVSKIVPILQDSCIECHGPTKKKAGLRLDRRDDVFDPVQDGLIVVGSPEESYFFEVIVDPEFPEERMPKNADPLPPEQVEAIRAWIAGGAEWPDSHAILDPQSSREEKRPLDAPVGKAEPADRNPAAAATDEAERLEAARLEAAHAAAEAASREAQEGAFVALREEGLHVQRIAADTDHVEANFAVLGPRATDEHVSALAGLEPTLAWLDLSRTSVTDAGVSSLAHFRELRRLNLARTAVSDDGLATVGTLGNLTTLNLYGTAVTDAGLEHLHALSKLERLYLWNTRVTDAGAKRLSAAVPGVSIDRGEAAKKVAALKPEPAKPIENHDAAAAPAEQPKPTKPEPAAQPKPAPREEDTPPAADLPKPREEDLDEQPR